jgi:hypothetical protein
MGIEALLSTQIIDTTTVGRAVMTAVDAAAARTAIGLGTLATQNGTITDYLTTANAATTYQPLDADLTALAALSGTNDIYYRSAANTWTAVTIGSGLSFTGGTLSATGGSGITSLNGLTGATQTFATATTGTDFAITSSGTAHTFSIPDASTTARGLITTGTQTIAGVKTFNGQLFITGGSQSSPSIMLTGGSANAIFAPYYDTQGGHGWIFTRSSFAAFKLSESAINLNNGAAFSWGNAFQGIGTTRLYRDDADHCIGQRNGVNAQLLRIYNTYTSSTSYERVSLGWSGNVCTLETQAGSGGGTLRGLRIGSASSSLIGLWGVTPIVQPTTAVAAATRVGGGGTALTDTDTFDGYTVSQIVKALRNIGALA